MATEINGWSIWNFHSIDKWINITKSIGFWKNGKFYLHWKAPFLLTKYMQKINTAKGLWLGFSTLERWFRKLHNTPESDSFAWPWTQSSRVWTNGHLLATPLHHPSMSATQPSQSDHRWNKLAPSFWNMIKKTSNKTELKNIENSLLSSEGELEYSEGEILFILCTQAILVNSKKWAVRAEMSGSEECAVLQRRHWNTWQAQGSCSMKYFSFSALVISRLCERA